MSNETENYRTLVEELNYNRRLELRRAKTKKEIDLINQKYNNKLEDVGVWKNEKNI